MSGGFCNEEGVGMFAGFFCIDAEGHPGGHLYEDPAALAARIEKGIWLVGEDSTVTGGAQDSLEKLAALAVRAVEWQAEHDATWKILPLSVRTAYMNAYRTARLKYAASAGAVARPQGPTPALEPSELGRPR